MTALPKEDWGGTDPTTLTVTEAVTVSDSSPALSLLSTIPFGFGRPQSSSSGPQSAPL